MRRNSSLTETADDEARDMEINDARTVNAASVAADYRNRDSFELAIKKRRRKEKRCLRSRSFVIKSGARAYLSDA